MHTSIAYGKKIQILRSGLINTQMWILEEKKLFYIHHNVLPDNGVRNWLPGHSGMQSLHETHTIFYCYCADKVPMCNFMHTEAETGPAFFTQLQEDLPVAVSIASVHSFPGCSFLDLTQDQSPGRQLGLLVLVPVGFAVGLRRGKRITKDRIYLLFSPS